MNHILQNLNEKQKEAVLTTKGPVLIIAGAGSGKTKALTHRIAYLIANGAAPETILAVTFTNKAAEEMATRVRALTNNRQLRRPPDGVVGAPTRASEQTAHHTPFIGTFHAFCVRVLRQEATKLGFAKNFSIFDDDDSLSLIKEVMKELDLNPKQYPAGLIAHAISSLKSELVTPDRYEGKDSSEIFPKTLYAIYDRYQKNLKRANAFDFDDLILSVVTLFQQHSETLLYWQNRFRYIHVDEYQDTNTAQYELIKLLAQKYGNIFVIGDDAQSIYGFRNADFRNMLNFEKDWPHARVIMLEENYRSTKRILEAANSVIQHNKDQKEKKLWTQNDEGEYIQTVTVPNERSEAKFITEEIQNLIASGRNYNDMVIMYRTNAQSRVIEEFLIDHAVPYVIIGGVRFYQRKEIKDLLAYLRYALNPNDTFSLKRIINVPSRGIGNVTFLKYLNQSAISLNEKGVVKIKKFEEECAEIKKSLHESPASRVISFMIKKIGYEQYLLDSSPNAENRIENIKELIGLAKRYDALLPPAGIEKMLENIALFSENDERPAPKQSVRLMTLHAAKGLEFPVVFIAGLEEGIFPHAKSMFSPTDLEEERRLCYVGITRAKEKLYLLRAHRRSVFGDTQANPASRFLAEIPKKIMTSTNYGTVHEDDEGELFVE